MTLKLIYPTMAMIFWIFVVGGILAMRRREAFQSKQVRPADVTVTTDAYPERARLASANFSNQFETPVVFFALIMVAMEVAATTYLMAVLAWAFVATRVVHTLIHTGPNNLRARAGAYAVGVLILVLMWLHIVLTLLRLP